ncbi:MAG TPA: tetratricopeptide repeat protein [Campylobacterales bacterium]|nr:tetratricopeptide repeat protein [Campylobacterales bacterium]
MRLIITTLLAYYFLLIFSTNQLFGLSSLYEKQILALGQKYERNGEYQRAYELYQEYQANNLPSPKIAERLNAIKPLIGGGKKTVKRSGKIGKLPQKFYAVQVLTTKHKYRKSAEREKSRLEGYGLSCYFKSGKHLYLRCNPVKTKGELKEAISILKSIGKDFFIVRDSNPPILPISSSPIPKQSAQIEKIKSRQKPKSIQETTKPKPIKQLSTNKNTRPSLNRNSHKGIQKKKKKIEKASKYTINQGYKALNDKQFTKAKLIFSDILKYQPDNIDAAFGYALVFMNEGDWTKAYITLNKIIDKTDREDIHKTYKSVIYNMNLKKGWKNVASDPAKSIEYFQKAGEIQMTSDVSEGLAYAYNNNKDFASAIPYAEKVYKKKKDFKSAKLLLQAYLKAKKKKKAREFFETLDPAIQANMEYNPKRDELLDEVEKLIKLKQYRKAKSLLRELYLLYPTNSKVLLYFAKVYQATKKYKSALEYYRTVLANDPTNSEALLGVAKIYLALKKYQKALTTLQTLKDNSSINVDKLINETQLKIYLKDGNKRKALVLAKEMIQDDPTNVELYITLGDLNMELKNSRDAYFYYGRAFQLAPDNFQVRIKLLNLLLEQNLFDQIQTLLENFRGFKMTKEQKKELRDFYLKFYKKYTAVSLEEKDYEYALKAAKAGLQMEPDDSFFIESAGWAGLNSKKYNDAIYYFSKILAKDPDNYTIRYGMGLAYVNLKQFDKAKEYFKYAEKSNDVDLLYKIAEIYKDIGFKKDSYRVVKLIEELGKHSIVKSTSSPKKRPEKKVEISPEMPTSRNLEYRDSMNTYNPFITNNEDVPKVTETVEPPEQNSISNVLPKVVPQNPEPEVIEIKKKSIWF